MHAPPGASRLTPGPPPPAVTAATRRASSNLGPAGSSGEPKHQSTHPDAVARRRAAEARRQDRARAALLDARLEVDELGWWEAPGSDRILNVTSRQQLDLHVARCAAEDRLLVVDFWSPSCYSCRVLHPKLVQMVEQHRDVTFVKVNCEAVEFWRELGVSKIPWFMFYRAGVPMKSFAASLSPAKLKAFRNNLLLFKEGSGGKAGGDEDFRIPVAAHC